MTQVVHDPGAVTSGDVAADRPGGHPPLRLAKVGRPTLWASRELIANLTRREVSGKYKRTVLGQLWSLVNPLALMLVYTLVFSVFFKQQPDIGRPSGLHNYALALMCGLLPWAFFSSGVTSGMQALITNSNLVLKVYFRRDALVTAQVLSLVVTFLFELAVLVVALVAFGGEPLVYVPAVLLAVAVLTLFTLGLALLLAVANVYFRDTQHLVGIVFQLLFYLSPVIYPLSRVQSELDKHSLGGVSFFDLYQLNPATRFIEAFRTLLYDNRLPPTTTIVYCLGATALVLGLGATVFNRFDGRLAEEL